MSTPLTPEERARLRAIAAGPISTQQPKDGQFFRDTARQLGVGTAMVPEMLAGVGDTAAGLAGYDRPFARGTSAIGEATGLSPKAWGEGVRETYSPALQRQQESYEGFWDAAGQQWARGNRLKAAGAVAAGAVLNPRAMSAMVFESLPASVLGGAVFGRAARAIAPSITPMTAGAVGQAPIFAGFTMSQIDESVDPQRAALAALGVGVGAAAIAKFGADLSYRLGLIDPHTAMAGGLTASVAPGTPQRSFLPRVGLGGLAEGVLQDMPQEALEQMGKNWAEDKPLFQDVPRRSVDGLIAGMGMGAMFNVMSPPTQGVPADLTERPKEPDTVDRDEPTAPVDPGADPGPAPGALAPMIEQYTKLAMFERQLPRFAGHPEYRERAREQMQRMEEQLVAQGLDPQALQLEVARKTYEDLQAKIAFAQQQGQDVRVNNLMQRAWQMENIFGRDELRGPSLTVVDRLRAIDAQQAQSLFTSDGQLRSRVATEYERIQDMAPATRATYLLAQLDIARADAEQGAVPHRSLPLYQALADEYGLRLPEKRVTPEPTSAVEGVPYAESALGLAERSEQQRMAEVRGLVQRIDAAMVERQRKAQLTEGQINTIAEAKSLPPVQDGFVRLYRAESPTVSFDEVFDASRLNEFQTDIDGQRWTTDVTYADYFRETYGRDAVIRWRDIPQIEAESRRINESEFAIQSEPTPVATPEPVAQPAPEPVERRQDENIATRERIEALQTALQDMPVDQMSMEQLREALAEARSQTLTDALTGMPNRLAYERAPKKAIQVSIDVDSLKWVNDKMGHQYGNQMLQAVAEALQGETSDSYRMSGDEFIIQAESFQEAQRLMDNVRQRLAGAVLEFTLPDGTVLTKTGIEVSYGADSTFALAEEALKRDKAARKATRVERNEQGQTVGDPVGVSRVPPAGREADQRAATTEAVTPAQPLEVLGPKRKPTASEGTHARYKRFQDAQGRATREANADSAHTYTVVAEGQGYVVHKNPVTTEVTPDAVQEPVAAEIPAQPEAEARQEVGEEVPAQQEAAEESRAEREVTTDLAIDPSTDAFREAVAVNSERIVSEELLTAIEELYSSINSDRPLALKSLRSLMEAAYEDATGRVEGSPVEIGRVRKIIDAVALYDQKLFQDAVLEVINNREVIPVTKTGKADSNDTRFFTDIVKAEKLRATAGKLTNVPAKKGEIYEVAKLLEKAEAGPVGMTVSKADAAKNEKEIAKFARETAKKGQSVASLVREQLSEDVDINSVSSIREEIQNRNDWGSPGRNFIADTGANISGPMPVGRIKATTNVFLSRLRGAKPNVTIFANQADMQAKNPDLYNRAAEASESGDFATSNAAGYMFGDGQIVIFSDRIYTPKQLKFILAHETLGHFGMRALFGNVRMNNLMDQVWHESADTSDLRKYVTKMQETHKDMTRQEAVEEYLSDFAAIVDASVLQRVWDALKRALNTLGLSFGDETARSMVYQSRRYVRNRGVRISLDADGRYMMTGPKADMSLLREYNLGRAKRLEKKGRSVQEILNKTGWIKGDDNKWRFEINDRNAKYIEKGKAELSKLAPMFAELEFQDTIKEKTIPLGDVLKHNRLFAAYPEAKNIRIGLLPITDPNLGTFFRKDNVIGINQRLFMPSRYRAESKQVEVLLHEVQHWIQRVEGFETGASATSNPELVFALTPKDLQVLGNILYQEGKQFWAQHIEARNIIQAINSKPPESLKKLRKLPYRSSDSITVRKAEEAVYTDLFGDTPEAGLSIPQKIVWDAVKKGPTEQQLDAAIDQDYLDLPSQQLLDGIVSGSKDSMYKYLRDHGDLYQKQIYREMYYKAYGEVEARAVEVRRAWTNWERKQKPFTEHMKELVTDVELLSKDIILKMNGRDMAGRLRIMHNADFEPAGHEISLEKMVEDMRAIDQMEDPGNVGRYFRNEDSLGHIHHVAGQDLSSRGYDSADVQRWMDKVKDTGSSIGDFMSRAIKEIRTMNYNARDNRGYRAFFRIMSSTVNFAISLRTKYNNMMPILMQRGVTVGGVKITDGITEAELQRTGQMAIDSTLYKFSHLPDANVIRGPKDAKPLVVIDENGDVAPNREVIDKMMEDARITPEQFKKGFSYTVEEVQPLSPQRRAELEAELADENTPKPRKREIAGDLESGATMVKVERKVAPRPEITADSIEYKGYLEAQKVMVEKAVDLLLANYAAAVGERTNIEEVISDAIGRDLTDTDKQFLGRIEDNYVALREEGMKYDADGNVTYLPDAILRGEKFLEMFNRAVLSKDDKFFTTQDAPKAKDYLKTMEYDDYVADFRKFREHTGGLKLSRENQYVIQHKIADLALFEMRKNDAELLAKRTIMGNYIPLGREGRFQVRIQAVDHNGNEVPISKRQRSQLIYMQLNNKNEGERTAQEINTMLEEASENKDGFFQTEIHKDGKRILESVKLVAQVEAARTKQATHSEVNLNEVLTTISRFNIQLTPQERAAITVGLTAQNAKARTRLRREGTPGYDVKNWTKYLSQDLEAAASVISRRKHRHLLDQLLDTTHSKSAELWYGNQEKYNKLKDKYETLSNDPNASPHVIDEAKRQFIDYHYTFVTKDSQKTANKFLDRAQMDLSFLEEQTSVEYTDFASGDLASRVRMATTFAQLGASFATALLNILALGTNVMPFLSSYNQKNNFGGGFGVANSITEMIRARSSTKWAGERAFAPFYDALMEGYNFKNPDSTAAEHVEARKRMAKEGFTPDEVVFMRDQIQAGVMQAALFNAMLGSARGRITKGWQQKGAQGWMYMFSHSEQAARRITGLAAYRLARNRALRSGQTPKIAIQQATDFAVSAINDTVGEYAMFNRPSLFRGGFQQFIFMYKMFPLTSVLLFSQMDKKGKLLMLGMLMFLSGAKGAPLGEDLMDIIDTIAQRTGMGPRGAWKGSAEATVAEFFASTFGEQWTPILMRGFVNNFMPVNLSDRTSLGNLIPGTGIGLYGANAGREALEVAGPFASFIADSAGTAGRLLEFGAGHAGLRPHTTTSLDILRQFPATMIRAAGDTVAYNQHGSVINQRGQIVSENMHLGVSIGRLLGFYPSSAVQEYDVIRMMSRLDNFQKEIVALHRQRWLKAKLMNDHAGAREIEQQVREWNETARGTPFEIRNFIPNSYRALRTARMTATERYKQSSAVAQRQHIDRFAELMGAGVGD